MAYSRTTLMLLLAVAASGCASYDSDLADDTLGGPMNDSMPPWSMCDTDTGTGTDTDGCDGTGTTAAADTTGAADSSCAGSEECSGDSICAASFDMSNSELGDFECQFTCIAELDDSQWCSDDASCCDAGAICTPRGYCVIGGDASTSGTGGSTGGDDTDTSATTGGQG